MYHSLSPTARLTEGDARARCNEYPALHNYWVTDPSIELRYSAQRFAEWGGPEGTRVAYLKSMLRHGFTSEATALTGHIHSPRQNHFDVAVVLNLALR
jgi:hypothetical protein